MVYLCGMNVVVLGASGQLGRQLIRVLPTDTVVLGSLEPEATVLLRPGTIVQVAGRMVTLQAPLSLVVSGAPVAQPATLPRTGDAAPVLWPMGLGLVLLLVGWRLRRAS